MFTKNTSQIQKDWPETISLDLIGTSAIESVCEEDPIQDKAELDGGTPEATTVALSNEQEAVLTEYWIRGLDVWQGHHSRVTASDVEHETAMLKWRELQLSNVSSLTPAFSSAPCLV